MTATLLQEIETQTEGADFHRADLHIHSFGAEGSYDVTDTATTPQAIVDTALKEQLEVIAITDHNSIGNVEPALEYAAGRSILVVPAVEVSTGQGHLLCYFPDAAKLRHFMGKLTISANRRSCSETLAQCLALADQFG